MIESGGKRRLATDGAGGGWFSINEKRRREARHVPKLGKFLGG
jgi:hypothetical protein